MHNPFLAYPRSQGWHAAHLAVDYATPIGVEFGAPAAGTYRRLSPNLSRSDRTAPGYWGELRLDDGRSIRFCHLDRHIAAHGRRVEEGDPLAVTGNTGYVLPKPTPNNPRAGAHMHTYGLTATGARWDWTLDASATLAGSKDDDDMTPEQLIAALTHHRPFPNGRNIFDQLIFVAGMTAIAANKGLIEGDASAEQIADELAKRLANG